VVARQADQDLDHVGAVGEQRLKTLAAKRDEATTLWDVGAEIDQHGMGIRQAAFHLPVDPKPIALRDVVKAERKGGGE